jgi:hypothetical protein
MSKFDRLPESDSDDSGEDEDIDPEEEARQRAALKRAQPVATKKLFAGLSSAIDGPASDLQAPGSGSAHSQETSATTSSEQLVEETFADFEAGDSTSI